MRATRGIRFIIGVTIAAIVCAGCTAMNDPIAGGNSSASSPPSYASPTPTAEFDQEVISLSLTVDGMAASNASGEDLSSVAFADGVEAAVGFLSEALAQQPEKTQYATDPCNGGTGVTDFAWGSESEVHVRAWQTPSAAAPWRASPAFVVSFGSPSIDSIALTAGVGLHVGQDSAGLFDALPKSQVMQVGASAFVAFPAVGGTFTRNGAESVWGLGALSDSGIITSVAAPTSLGDFQC